MTSSIQLEDMSADELLRLKQDSLAGIRQAVSNGDDVAKTAHCETLEAVVLRIAGLETQEA